MCERRGLAMLTAIAIGVNAVDRCGKGIRWVKPMTSVLPDWHLIPSFWRTDRREEVGFRQGIREGVLRLQIGNGMPLFSVTASPGGVIVIDIAREGGSSSVGATGDAKQARKSKDSVDLGSNGCRCVEQWSVKQGETWEEHIVGGWVDDLGGIRGTRGLA